MEGIWAVARARLRRRWSGLLAIGLLAGVVGGLTTGAIAGERRTVTVAPRLIEATRAHDAILQANGRPWFPDEVNDAAARLRSAIDAQPGVRAVWPIASFIGRTTQAKDWYYPYAGVERDPEIYRPILAAGRVADPSAIDEVVVTAQTAANNGLQVGSSFAMDFYSPEQMERVLAGSEEEPVGAHVRFRVVGLLRDAFDIAPAATSRFMLATPAFARRYGPIAAGQRGFAVKLDAGTAGTERFVAGMSATLGPGAFRPLTNLDALRSNRSADQVARANILLLAAIVAALGLFILSQVIRRHLGQFEAESRTLRALGLTVRDRLLAATAPSALAGVVAAAGVVAVSYLLSPVFPLGRPRRLEPEPGFDLNVAVTVLGAVATAVAVVGLFALVASVAQGGRRAAPTRVPVQALKGLAANASASVILGSRLALQPSRTRGVATGRSAVVGAAMGIAGLVAATTFASSLQRLVETPRDFGLDYDVSIEVPSELVQQRSRELAADPSVEAVAVQGSGPVQIGGSTVTAVGIDPVERRVDPVLRSGRLPSGADELALGPSVARRLDIELGDRIDVSGRSMVVVGTVLDTVSTTQDFTGGALLTESTLSQLLSGEPGGYYRVILARFDDDADADVVFDELDRRYPYGVMDESRPAVPSAVQNVDDVRGVPRILAAFFAGLVLVALGNGLVVAGRRHRQQFAVVRALGFTSGQIRGTLTAMAVSMSVVALAFGVPIGLSIGAWSWSAVSRDLDIAPSYDWPLVVVVAAVPLVIGVSCLMALWPSRRANAERPAAILRSE